MAIHSNLKRRGGAYSFRITVPRTLRRQFEGRREIVRGLGTSNPREAVRRAATCRVLILQLFRDMANGKTLSSEQIEAELQRIATARAGGMDLHSTNPDETPAELAASIAADYWHDYEGGDYSRVIREADAVLARLKTPLTLGSPEYHELCRGLLLTFAQLYRLTSARLSGDTHAALTHPLNPALASPWASSGSAPAPALAPSGPPLSELLLGLFADKKGDWKESTRRQADATYRLFLSFAGDHPPAAYTRATLSDFYQQIALLPSKYGQSQSQRDKSLAEIIAAAPPTAPRITGKTISRHATAMIQLFAYLKRRGTVAENPASGHGKHSKKAKQHKPTEVWQGEELRKLFAAPVWQGCASVLRRATPGKKIIRDDKYWLPLLGLYAGARLEEMAQLRRQDVAQDQVSGLWCLSLTDEGEGQLKNIQSRRRVPLHPRLVALGFPEYAAAIGSKPGAPVFPKLNLRRGGADNRFGFSFTKWFSRYRHSIGVARERLTFKSFRTTFITKLNSCGVSDATIQALVGHEGKTVLQTNYVRRDATPMRSLHVAVSLASYEELEGLFQGGPKK